MTADLVAFLRARLDEDERAAEAATPGPWTVDSETYAETIHSSNEDVIAGGRWGGEASVFTSTEDALHIARHDPARVLAEVDAKRRIIDLHDELDREYQRDRYDESTSGQLSGVRFAIRFLALSYADHPDYLPEWEPR